MSAVDNDIPPRQVQVVDRPPPTMMAYLAAVKSGADLERLEKLMELHERWEAIEARKAFNLAMALFRADPMPILKTKYVDVPGGAKFFHAEIAAVCDAVIPTMSKYELRHQWIPRQLDDGLIEVSCVITHALGHSETTTLRAPPDTSGKKNPVQEVASTITYLERYTLLAATGLAAKGIDHDGNRQVPEGAVTVAKPGDFDRWDGDAEVVAEDGLDALMALWKKTPEDLRDYITVAQKSRWKDLKAIAIRNDKKREGK